MFLLKLQTSTCVWKYSTLKGRPRVAHAHMRAEDPTLGAVYQVAKVPEEPVLNSGANPPEYKHLHPQRADVTLANGVKVTDPFFVLVYLVRLILPVIVFDFIFCFFVSNWKTALRLQSG